MVWRPCAETRALLPMHFPLLYLSTLHLRPSWKHHNDGIGFRVSKQSKRISAHANWTFERWFLQTHTVKANPYRNPGLYTYPFQNNLLKLQTTIDSNDSNHDTMGTNGAQASCVFRTFVAKQYARKHVSISSIESDPFISEVLFLTPESWIFCFYASWLPLQSDFQRMALHQLYIVLWRWRTSGLLPMSLTNHKKTCG